MRVDYLIGAGLIAGAAYLLLKQPPLASRRTAPLSNPLGLVDNVFTRGADLSFGWITNNTPDENTLAQPPSTVLSARSNIVNPILWAGF